ncbi:hypothetical protein PHET_02404 [Paragonimus heterotremus]|uniref:Uncharacterized protein n=1 Tax=Paragonimus heterotremus TaxID=100268 RepID=A0A8J4WJW3_9TREM|nr:hypothetical protein PHET_02404 [Paragonimus heterotremus]
MVQSACGKPIFHGPDPNDYALTSPHDAVSEVVLTSHPRHKQSSYGGAPLVEQKDSQLSAAYAENKDDFTQSVRY